MTILVTGATGHVGRLVVQGLKADVRAITRDPAKALEQLYAAGRQHVWLEGGPTLAAAFLRAGLVDEIYAYVAPTFLGAGANAVGDLGITTIDDQLRWHLKRAAVIGTGADATVRLTLNPGGDN